MKARISFPIVVMGPVHNGCTEHPAIITRVFGADDTEVAPVCVNATMFPDGGGDPQHQSHIFLYDSREAALTSSTNHRKAYWAANS